MKKIYDRLHPLGFKGWIYTFEGPLEIQIYDFFINNRGRINHHEEGGLPLYWVKSTTRLNRKDKRLWAIGHAIYGDEIYPTKAQARGCLV